MSSNFFKLLLATFAIISISFLVFLPSFHLALFGDDWLAFFRFAVHVAPQSSTGSFNFAYLFTPYGAQDIWMGLLKSVYGLHSTYYYATSFLFRLYASFSLFPLIFYLTKDKLATFFAILFFSTTVVGIDATNWVFNMPSYITISFFNLSLYFFIKSREEGHLRQLFIASFFYYLAYIITPIRMHGSLPFLFLLESLWVIQRRDIKTLKKASIRFAIILMIFLFIKFSGSSLGPSTEITDRLTQGLTISSLLIGKGRLDFIFHPLVMFGSMLIPDFAIQQLVGLSSINFSIFILSIVFLFFFFIICLVLTNTSKELRKRFFSTFLLCSFIWLLTSWFLFPKDIQPFPNNTITPAASFILLSIGGFAVILLALLLRDNLHKEKLSVALFTSLTWPFLAFLAAWWFTPQVIFPTAYRYLIVSVTGISLLLALIISLGKEVKQKIILMLILSPLLALHALSTHSYLNTTESFHGQKITDKIWSSIPYIPEMGKKPLVFYFETADNNFITLHNSVTFGFPPHMQILYNLREQDYAPVPMSNWTEVVSAVKDGQSFKAYGYPLKPIPVENVYAFSLQGSDTLINITDAARQKLIEEKQK